MEANTRKAVQTVLAIALLLAAVRLVWIFYSRQANTAADASAATPPLDPDAYVTPRKLYAYDLESAKALTQQPVWVREGYRYSFYPYDRRKGAELEHEAGVLGPLQKLDIQDVVLERSPGSPGQRQVMAVFEQAGKQYAFPIGAAADGNYQIYADEMLYLEDPRQLYSHWPQEAWQAIDKGTVTPGMSELQASFAAGVAVLQGKPSGERKTLVYPRNGDLLVVVFQNGRAVEVREGN